MSTQKTTETRTEKAQRLIDTGCVEQLRYVGSVVVANVQGDHGYYHGTTFFPDGTFYCDCEWGKYNYRTHDLCAHALAVAKLATGKMPVIVPRSYSQRVTFARTATTE